MIDYTSKLPATHFESCVSSLRPKEVVDAFNSFREGYVNAVNLLFKL
jgi:hypothetical protein